MLAKGVFMAELADPELCNAFSTNLWELDLLMNHYDPAVQAMARKLSKGDFSKIIIK